MTFKAKALLVGPLGLHLEFDGGPLAVNMVPGKTYIFTVEESQPAPIPAPVEKPFAASVVTTQNPWIEG